MRLNRCIVVTLLILASRAYPQTTQIDPAQRIKWPTGVSGCSYTPASNTCVAMLPLAGGTVTGAINTSRLLSQLNPANVMHPVYGCAGTGLVSDSACLQAAVNAAAAGGYGEVDVPPGTYLLTATLTVSSATTLRCIGTPGSWNDPHSCTFMKSSSFTPAICASGSTLAPAVCLSGRGSGMDGIAIDANPAMTGAGIQLAGLFIRLRNVTVQHQGVGIYIGDPTVSSATFSPNYWLLDSVTATINTLQGLVINKPEAGPTQDANAGTAINSHFSFNGQEGVLSLAANGNTFVGLSVEQNGAVAGFHIGAGGGLNTIIGGDFNEGNVGTNLLIDAGVTGGSVFWGVNIGAHTDSNTGTFKSLIGDSGGWSTASSSCSWGGGCQFPIGATLANVIATSTIYTNVEFSNGTCTTALTVNPANGNNQKVTLTNANTCALTLTQPASGTATVQLKVIQSAVSTFNGGISGCKWPGGIVPTITQTSGAIDIISIYLDGTTAYCKIAQAFS